MAIDGRHKFKYYHYVKKWRRTCNAINGLIVKRSWCEDHVWLRMKFKIFLRIS